MTFRDANAANMTDYFNFHRAHFRQPPALAAAPDPAPGLARCAAGGPESAAAPAGVIGG